MVLGRQLQRHVVQVRVIPRIPAIHLAAALLQDHPEVPRPVVQIRVRVRRQDVVDALPAVRRVDGVRLGRDQTVEDPNLPAVRPYLRRHRRAAIVRLRTPHRIKPAVVPVTVLVPILHNVRIRQRVRLRGPIDSDGHPLAGVIRLVRLIRHIIIIIRIDPDVVRLPIAGIRWDINILVLGIGGIPAHAPK